MAVLYFGQQPGETPLASNLMPYGCKSRKPLIVYADILYNSFVEKNCLRAFVHLFVSQPFGGVG